MTALPEIISNPKIEPKDDVNEPSLFKIIYINDDSTTMDFVIDSLVSIFSMTADSALGITQRIHEDGSAVVAIMPYELAEQKGIEVTIMARSQGFPLQIKLEADQ